MIKSKLNIRTVILPYYEKENTIPYSSYSSTKLLRRLKPNDMVKYTLGNYVTIDTFCGERVIGKVTKLREVPKNAHWMKTYMDLEINSFTLYKYRNKFLIAFHS